ncbi:DUF2075 domain-containing protein [Proteiniclasticum sp. BAD-10]|uniref:DUF2075 domain-containing protein n=1 Tax=Proteiniclasticum sediminis TaxID=2804028 RepID=A0A941CNN3_9CLOT|nr:DNA/RNA helicase domain-containing protein [Proteiniclasticum sediminis]MBR0575925.1 DUF2075 domain-containing protein [Proteiniclasticum sediminis]
MTRPINIYTITRVQDENSFNVVEKHESSKKSSSITQCHEISSLRILVDEFKKTGFTITDFDGFFFSYSIPQIGKEFDLLKFTKTLCVNIELKSETVSEEQILTQLRKNRHYLSHLGKRLIIYSVITDTMKCYKLSSNEELVGVDITEITDCLKGCTHEYSETIDDKFRVADYLVSPLTTPDKFIQGEYFLTQSQEQIKKEILKGIDGNSFGGFYHIIGKPGTGKTLLLYDIAKALSIRGKTLIIHCGKLSTEQIKIRRKINDLQIVSAADLRRDDFCFSEYSYLIIDESHRIYISQFEAICEAAKENMQSCIFSSDPGQVLSRAEKRNAIVDKIRSLDLEKECELSEKIRMNMEMHSFIARVLNLNHKPKKDMDYSNISINFANTKLEAQSLIDYFRKKEYVFINYTKSNYKFSPYSEYEEDYDTHHVIGKEYDKVVLLMDNSFYYDEYSMLRGIQHPNPDYLYPNLFYQGVTRTREKLAIIVVEAPTLFSKLIQIIEKA